MHNAEAPAWATAMEAPGRFAARCSQHIENASSVSCPSACVVLPVLPRHSQSWGVVTFNVIYLIALVLHLVLPSS